MGSLLLPGAQKHAGIGNGSATGSLLRKSGISHCCDGNLTRTRNYIKNIKPGAKQLDEGGFFLSRAIPSPSSRWGVGACAAGHNTAPPMEDRPRTPAPGAPPCSQQHPWVSSPTVFQSSTFLTEAGKGKGDQKRAELSTQKGTRSYQEPHALNLCILKTQY